MRTIRRVSRRLNTGKWQDLAELVRRYAREKDAHLSVLGLTAQFVACPSHRARRDQLVAARYINPNGLQARTWKMALQDAHETVKRQWAALAAALRGRVARQPSWNEVQKHYAYWLLQSPQGLAQLVYGRAPLPTHFEINLDERVAVQSYLRRVIRRTQDRRGLETPARVKKARSAAFDADMYQVFEQDGAQYIKLMSLKPGQRIVIPLSGNTPIVGNIRVVLDDERRQVEIHYTAEVKAKRVLSGEPCGLDAGVSEVFTDEEGSHYQAEFGQVLGRTSERLKDKGRKRNKLYQIARQAEAKGDKAKARRIRQKNLGRQKQTERRRRARAELARRVNTAVNEVLDKRQPEVIVTEKLDIRGKATSKRLSRQVSMWTRSILNDRVDFKASAGGSRREQVNPAYTSQTCPECGYVHRDNRRGNAFQCQNCRHADDADRVAAHNLRARYGDPQISLWTPKERVKAILLDRFNARLERGRAQAPPTVSGRTLGASGAEAHRQPESETASAILP